MYEIIPASWGRAWLLPLGTCRSSACNNTREFRLCLCVKKTHALTTAACKVQGAVLYWHLAVLSFYLSGESNSSSIGIAF